MPLLCTSYEESLPLALLRVQEQTALLPPPSSERREISQPGFPGVLLVQAPAVRRSPPPIPPQP